MIILYYGTDTCAVRDAAFTRADQEAGTVVIIDHERYEPGILTDAVASTSLFGEQFTYVIDTPKEDAAMHEELLGILSQLAALEAPIVIIEPALTAQERSVYATHAADVTEYKKVKTDSFNVFSLANALARKDKKALWTGLQDAWRVGLKSEQIIGTLWWQLTALRAAAAASSPEEAGLKPYPYQNAARALATFPLPAVEAAAAQLLQVQHDSFTGGLPLDLALERWVLGL